MTDKPTLGRPQVYTKEVFEGICQRIRQGESLHSICHEEGMPTRQTFFNWLHADKDLFDNYNASVTFRTHVHMEEIVNLSDTMPDGACYLSLANGQIYSFDEVMKLSPRERQEQELKVIGLTSELVQKRKLQIDARIKAASQMNPKVYGQKLETKSEISGPNGGPIKGELVVTPEVLTDAMKLFKESL